MRAPCLAAFAALFLVGSTSFEVVGAPAARDARKPYKPLETDVADDINVPRKDARIVKFEVSSGTWMSVDLSPDGRTLVFDLLGDIWQVPASGGDATPLTQGPAFDAQPRFSPDGKRIAFHSDRTGIDNIWVMAANGGDPQPVTEEEDNYVRSPVWSLDGETILARKEEATKGGIPPVELWMYHLHGGSGIAISSKDDIDNVSGPEPSPDGRSIYFSARHARFDYIPDISRGLWQVWRLDRTTGESWPVTSGIGGAVRPRMSPDGKRLAYVTRRDAETVIVERDLDRGTERLIARDVARDEQEGFAQLDLFPSYCYSPDGTSLYFTAGGKIRRVDLATLDATDVPFRARVTHHLAPRVAWQERVESGPVRARILRWPSVSSDGRWVAFDAFGRVYLQELAAGKPKGAPIRLTNDDASLPPREYAPAFSPDSQWLAYVTWSDREGGSVHKARVPETSATPRAAPVRLTRHPGHFANPAWSPSGDRIALLRGSGLEWRGRQPEEEDYFMIEWMEASGGELHAVVPVRLSASMRFHPQAFWSQDGTRIFLREPVEPPKPSDPFKNDLVSVRLDGTDRKRHLRFPAISDLVPSPDGKWVAFTSRDNVFVTAMPSIVLPEPPEVGLEEGALPVWRLSDDAGGYVGWTEGGAALTWGLGNRVFRLRIEDALKFVDAQRRKARAAESGEDDKEDGDDDDAKTPPSQWLTIALEAPRPEPSGSVLIRGARLVTMRGDEVIPRGDVVVTGSRIVAVGATGTVAVPEGTRVIEGEGMTVVPGIIDTHAHLHYSAFELFPETKWEYIANLAYGVTTVYDPSAPSLDVFAQAEMVEAGLMTGPRVYSSGDVLYGGQDDDIFAEVNSIDDARSQVRRMKAYGARMIKVYQQPKRSQRMWFAEACRELGMLLTAEGAGEMEADLTMAFDGYTAFEHSLPVELEEDVVQLVARSRTHYTPTLLVSYGGPWGELYFWQTRNPYDDAKLNRFVPRRLMAGYGRRHPWIALDEYHFPIVASGVARVARAGGNVSLGAHGQLQGLGPHWEMWAMAGEGGAPGSAMTPMEALRASTLQAADKIGFTPDLGSIEVGKLADLVVLRGNPLEDIHVTADARWVMKGGVLWDANTMSQVHPSVTGPPEFFWQR